jgi:hypothetical protein
MSTEKYRWKPFLQVNKRRKNKKVLDLPPTTPIFLLSAGRLGFGRLGFLGFGWRGFFDRRFHNFLLSRQWTTSSRFTLRFSPAL